MASKLLSIPKDINSVCAVKCSHNPTVLNAREYKMISVAAEYGWQNAEEGGLLFSTDMLLFN
jgi:hypothetical protein